MPKKRNRGVQNTPSPNQKASKKHKEQSSDLLVEDDGSAPDSGSETEVGRTVAESACGSGSSDPANSDATQSGEISAVTMPTHETLDQVVIAINKSIENLATIMRGEMANTQKANLAIINDLRSKFEGLEKSVKIVQDQIAEKDKEIEDLRSDSVLPHMDAINRRIELLQQLELHNFLQIQERIQRSRCWTIRVSNYRCKNENSKPTSQSIWDRLFKPALETAVKENNLKFVPDMDSAIENSHILFTNKDNSETWLFRFQSRKIMFKYIEYRTGPLKNLNIQNMGENSYSDVVKNGNKKDLVRTGQDLSSFNRTLMSTLISYKADVGLCRLAGTRVMVALKRDMIPGAKLKWWPVQNPLGDSLEAMLKPPVDIFTIVSDLMGTKTPPVIRSFIKYMEPRKNQYSTQP